MRSCTSLLRLAAAITVIVVVSSAKVVEITEDNFDEMVGADNTVWVIEFASKMCGSCQDFAPTYKAVAGKQKSLRFGMCYIDSKPGIALAQRFGAMEVGLPSAVLFGSPDPEENEFVVKGEVLTKKAFMGNLKAALKGLQKNADGQYQKAAKATRTEL